VNAAEPTIYLIHNLLSPTECDSLIEQAASKVTPVVANRPDPLQFTTDPEKFVKTQRVLLWHGTALQGPVFKAVEERIEQVTGFPSAHYSDWVVDMLTAGSYWQPHFDILAGNFAPLATITVFLSSPNDDDDDDGGGGELVFPSVRDGDPVMVRPVRGLAVVHHNTNEHHEFETRSLHAMLPVTADGEYFVARKFILPLPVSNARRVALPLLAMPLGGVLPGFVVSAHDLLIDRFGVDKGGMYFDKVVVFVPVLILLILAQRIASAVQRNFLAGGDGTAAKAPSLGEDAGKEGNTKQKKKAGAGAQSALSSSAKATPSKSRKAKKQ
jgi:hypothetical protein